MPDARRGVDDEVVVVAVTVDAGELHFTLTGSRGPLGDDAEAGPGGDALGEGAVVAPAPRAAVGVVHDEVVVAPGLDLALGADEEIVVVAVTVEVREGHAPRVVRGVELVVAVDAHLS
ncbi:hypothetical protein [Streptomyces sp. NPDC004629]|uniref:hypothetical protein n=1 Tax=Streptomyces sp. NPDC004629 TaxID=3364705 RepID=UPI0036C93676